MSEQAIDEEDDLDVSTRDMDVQAASHNERIPGMGASTVVAQPEMEKRRSPLV